MGKFLCECGHVITDTCGSDAEIFIEYECYGIKAKSLGMWECDKCGNIMIEDPNESQKIISYKPISDIYNKILLKREKNR